MGNIITINGIERIKKSYYSDILNHYLKSRLGEDKVKKFSFPSFTTKTGKILQRHIKQFKKINDVNAAGKYKKIMELMLQNFEEYQKYIDLHQETSDLNVVIINNNYHSVIAHALAIGINYRDILSVSKKYPFLYRDNENNILEFFLIPNNVEKVLDSTPNSYEIYGNRDVYLLHPNELLSVDYLNFQERINDYYRQLFLINNYRYNRESVLIDIDMNDINHISNTNFKIKNKVVNYLGLPLLTNN